MTLKNIMEDLVLNELENIMKNLECCLCEECRLDVAALALNRIPPLYVVSEKGEIFSKINALSIQFKTDVLSAITAAVIIVKQKPRHKTASV